MRREFIKIYEAAKKNGNWVSLSLFKDLYRACKKIEHEKQKVTGHPERMFIKCEKGFYSRAYKESEINLSATPPEGVEYIEYRGVGWE